MAKSLVIDPRTGHYEYVDDLERSAKTVGAEVPRDWVLVHDASLVEEFERLYAEALGRPASPELLRIEHADGAVRVSYAGGTIVDADPNGDDVDLLEAVSSAARTLGRIERENEWH